MEGSEEASRKRKKQPEEEQGESEENVLAVFRFAAFDEDEDEDEGMVEVEEAALMAAMKELEEEIAVKTTSSSRMVLGGNEEICGSSFSDSASTVMASFDTTAMACLVGGTSDLEAAAAEVWPWAVGSGGEVGSTSTEEEEEENKDEDEWLARVLGGPDFDFEEYFL